VGDKLKGRSYTLFAGNSPDRPEKFEDSK